MVEWMDYYIKLQHKAGSKMIVADALSRRADWSKGLEDDNDQVIALPDNLWIRLLDMEIRNTVAKGLTNDSTAQEAMKRLSETEVSPTNWTLENSGQDSTTPFLFYNGRLYIPDEIDLQHQIVRDHHDTPTAGHLGVLATCRSIRTSYWWPGLFSFVPNYVTGCGVCQQFKVNTQLSKPSLVPINALSSRIFGQVGIDFMTDLPESEGYDSIMVTVDHGLSKGVILTPCSKKGLTAEHTAHEYNRQKMAEKIKSMFKLFLLGQQVWLEGRNLNISYNKKITTKREGPFKITEKMSPVNYKLQLPNKWNIHDTFHAVLLSPYKETQVHGPNFTCPPPDLVDGEEEYKVDRILKDRQIHAKKGKWCIEYQVQWKGYEEPTWEPSENLSHAKDVILDYWTCKRKNNPDDHIACLILERGLTTDVHMIKLLTESLS